MPRIPNKDLARFMQSFSRTRKKGSFVTPDGLVVSIRWAVKAQKAVSNSVHLHSSICDQETTV